MTMGQMIPAALLAVTLAGAPALAQMSSDSMSSGSIRRLPTRTQITRHDCVEGWSAIGKWTGVPLKLLLDNAGVRPNTRYIVFHCARRRLVDPVAAREEQAAGPRA